MRWEPIMFVVDPRDRSQFIQSILAGRISVASQSRVRSLIRHRSWQRVFASRCGRRPSGDNGAREFEWASDKLELEGRVG